MSKHCCSFEGCNYPSWRNYKQIRYCKYHWNASGIKKPKIIKSVSDKQKQKNLEYSKVRKEFLSKPENSFCRVQVDGCLHVTGLELQIHHMMGRIGKLLTDTKYFLPCCGNCHRWVEDNSLIAKELGFSLNRK